LKTVEITKRNFKEEFHWYDSAELPVSCRNTLPLYGRVAYVVLLVIAHNKGRFTPRGQANSSSSQLHQISAPFWGGGWPQLVIIIRL